VLVRIDVGADLCSAQTQLTHASLQLLGRKIGILQRDRPEPCETGRIFPNDLGDVIVQPAGKIERVGRFRPIAEHHRHGGEDLHRHSGPLAVFDSARRFPDIVRDLAKGAIADHHPGAARCMVLHPNEPGITVFRVQIRPLPWQDVSMQIDFHVLRCN